MSVIKIIVIGILFMSVGTVTAWDDESGYAEGEEIETEFVEGYNRNQLDYMLPKRYINIFYRIPDKKSQQILIHGFI